jgi:tetratricopeptide (TPR) repeat protein
VATISKSLFLVVLGGSTLGLAQQPPVTLESLFHSAQQAQASGDFITAVNDYTQAAKMRPDMPAIWANLGLTQQEASNIPAAIEAFQRANRLAPSLYVPNLFLGIDYAHSGRAHQAIPFLIRAGKTNPSDAQAPLALGRAYIAAREYSQAIPELNRALDLNAKLSTAWFDLGIAQLDQVESDARTISIENKQSPFAGALYAESLGKQGRFGEAASLYKSILDSKPQPPCLHSELGFALLRDHKEAEAGPLLPTAPRIPNAVLLFLARPASPSTVDTRTRPQFSWSNCGTAIPDSSRATPPPFSTACLANNSPPSWRS